MPKVKRSQCALLSKHVEWGFPEHCDLDFHTKIPRQKIEEMLTVVGKSIVKNYFKSPPKFCKECLFKFGIYTTQHRVQSTTECTSAEMDVTLVETAPLPRLPTETESIMETDSATTETLGVTSKILYECIKCGLASSKRNVACQTDSSDRCFDFENMDQNDKAKLAYQLAKSELDAIVSNKEIVGEVRSLSELSALCLKTYETDSNPVVVKFLRGVAGTSFEPCKSDYDTREEYKLVKTVESVLNLAPYRSLLPLHFRESVICYTLTGSSLMLKVMSGSTPGGGYKAVKSWLRELSGSSMDNQTGELLVAFDNNQIMKRRWKVRLHNTVQCDVVTMIVIFIINTEGQLQTLPLLKPDAWMTKEISNVDKEDLKSLDQRQDIKKSHWEFLYPYLDKMLNFVSSEQEQIETDDDNETVFNDPVDEKVKQQNKDQLFKKCYRCGFTDVPRSKRNCTQCKYNINKGKIEAAEMKTEERREVPSCRSENEYRFHVKVSEDSRIIQKEKVTKTDEVYSDYPNYHQNHPPPTLKVLDPAFINPCSYEACVLVLRKIAQSVGIDDDSDTQNGSPSTTRKWVAIVCDGVPYNLCRRIISSYILCPFCKLSFAGYEKGKNHVVSEHHIPEDENISFHQEFGWALLLPGPGHVEINMVRSFVELTWDIFYREMCVLFNFRSDIALHYCKKVSDHHKGWTLCRIAHEALVAELMVPFVRNELVKDEPTITPAAFIKYTMLASDHTYSFLCDLVLEILNSIFMYRAGVRSGNQRFMEAGRAKFSKIWSARSHPLYRELEMADSVMKMRAPAEVSELLSQLSSLNMSGEPYTGEGGDFRLEEVNKQVQQWLPKSPTAADWVSVCRSHDGLNTLRDSIFKSKGIQDPKGTHSKHTQCIKEEVLAFRALVRQHNYASESGRVQVESLTGATLDSQLKDLNVLAREQRSKFCDAYLEHEQKQHLKPPAGVPFQHTPVLVTENERREFEAIENKTIREITATILTLVESIEDDDMRQTLKSVCEHDFIRKKKNKPIKADYVAFYYEVREYMDTVGTLDQTDSCDNDAEDWYVIRRLIPIKNSHNTHYALCLQNIQKKCSKKFSYLVHYRSSPNNLKHIFLLNNSKTEAITKCMSTPEVNSVAAIDRYCKE